MLTSAELRWFKRGKLPQEISKWFQQDDLEGQLQQPEEREDLYLYSPGIEYLGLKLRQGRLEIKWRKAELGVRWFGDRVEGKVEKWGKWLCQDSTGESFQLTDIVGEKSWVSVKKVRSQRLYENCALELTQLNIGGNDWWSLAFEASDDDSLIDNLKTVANLVFKTYNGLELQAQDSYAYPSWLDIVIENFGFKTLS